MENRKEQSNDFTRGSIPRLLIRFSLPVLFALLLQALYGAVDLLVVGQFAAAADVSAVATGSNIMITITNPLSSFAMGITVLLGYQIGQKKAREAGNTIGAGIVLFAGLAVIVTLLLVLLPSQIASLMHAPEEAFQKTVSYVRICGMGSIAILSYNLLGSVFRGIGDSRTPLISVAIACVINIAGDLILVAGLHLGAAGAAMATVGAQLISVLISLAMIRKKELGFTVTRSMIRFDPSISAKITRLGLPLALSDFMVGISFMIIQAIVNSLGLIPSAGIGVAEKVCAFIMLVPSAFMQSMAAFTAQNIGAGKQKRAEQALRIGILLSLTAGCLMFFLSFFRGDLLCSVFARDPEVIAAGADYLKAYAIDCLFTAVFFVFTGFYNGMGLTRFVMAQGIISAFGVRIPVSYFMSKIRPVSLFKIGLATPLSSALQIIMCLGCLWYVTKKNKNSI